MFNQIDNLEEARAQIVHDLKEHSVVLYMKGDPLEPRCGFSARAVECLEAIGHSFESRDVLLDDALRAAIKEHADWPTIPQLYICGEFIGGCDIIESLFKSGELEQLIKSSSK